MLPILRTPWNFCFQTTELWRFENLKYRLTFPFFSWFKFLMSNSSLCCFSRSKYRSFLINSDGMQFFLRIHKMFICGCMHALHCNASACIHQHTKMKWKFFEYRKIEYRIMFLLLYLSMNMYCKMRELAHRCFSEHIYYLLRDLTNVEGQKVKLNW